MLLSATGYSDESCPLFRTGLIHSDETVLPADVRAEVLRRCANYIEGYTAERSGEPGLENTFVLSSWYASRSRFTYDLGEVYL